LEITGQNGNRELAYAYLDDGKELSQEMLKAGLAWHFKKYNSDPILAQLETEAKNLKKGLWQANNPMPPWVNKSLHKQGISTKDSFVAVDSDNMNPLLSD
jgi:endonuclease YncB( thermonuclease family)